MKFSHSLLFILLLLLCGCRSSKVLQDTALRQTTIQIQEKVDSVLVFDSIAIKEMVRGDTVYIERTKWKVRTKTHYKYIEGKDSIQTIVKMVEVTTKETDKKWKYFKTGIFIGAILWMLAIWVFRLVRDKISQITQYKKDG